MLQPDTSRGARDGSSAQAALVRLQQREHPMCVVCSPHNPNGLKLKFAAQPDGSVLAVFDCLPILASYSEVLHGGVIATILDSAMLYALFAIDVVAVTVALEVSYLAPTVTGRFATVRGWTENASAHPLYSQRAQLIQDGRLKAEAHAKFIVPGVV